MDEILKLRNVSKQYPGFKLDNINMSLLTGCIMGFIGENGAGKTTTIKSILDLIHIDSGEIEIFGEKHTELSKGMKEHIAVVMDTLNFPGEMTGKNVNTVMNNIYATWDREAFETYLKKFKIDIQKRIKDYSRGMKMKLSLAVALAHDTKLLILDEATSGMDPVVRESVLDILLEFIQDETHSVLISSHILSDLEKICDYITFIHDGKIILSENKDELMEKYGVLKCSRAQLEDIDEEAIIDIRVNRFGAEALVVRDSVPQDMVVDAATLEEIMVFFAKEAK